MPELIEVEYTELVHQTAAAYLFKFEKEEVWIAKSVVEDINQRTKCISIPSWVVEQSNLDMYVI
jgi:hypothetical protein